MLSVLSHILTIARNTFRETIRDRILYGLIVFILLITVSSIFIGELTNENGARVVVNLGLSAILLFGAFIATFVGVGLVFKEIEKRTIYAVFAKPVSRAEFLIGKYVGLCLTLAINILVMSLGVCVALFYVGGSRLLPGTLAAIFLIYLELTIITAVAITFSSFSSPVLSALLTFTIFIIGHFSTALREFAETISSEATRFLLKSIYYFLPNLSFFSFATAASHGETPSISYILTAFLYALVYIFILLSIAVTVFSRRNFK